MAGKTKRMSQIKQLLRLHKQGKGKREIGRILNISKNTVKAYIEKSALLKLSIDELLKLDEFALETKFHVGNPAYCDERFTLLKSKLDYYIKELQRTGVTRKLLWEEYRQDYPSGYGLTQFCYHLSQQVTAGKPSMVLQHKAGDELYVDFAGKTLSYTNRETGEVVEVQVFVACLPYSDFGFVMAVPSQCIDDFLYALKCCLNDIGGAPQALVPDNLKSAVIKANKYEPTINRALEDFANHYGTLVVPARDYKPKDKALVENQVRLTYTRVYAKLRNEIFFDINDLNKAIKEKTKAHNQTRMQQKPYSREENFLANEKHLLGQLPVEDFEIKYYRQSTVAKNNHIFLTQNKHYYSVPYKYIGTKVDVIYTRNMVYIYTENKQIAVHPRSYDQGKYTTAKEHLCSHHQHYLERSPDYYIQRATSKGENFHQLITEVFGQNRYPEQLYRTCDGLFSLQRKTESEKFNKACALSLEYKNYSYHFLSNIIKNNMVDRQQTEEEKSLPKHKNIRGKQYFK